MHIKILYSADQNYVQHAIASIYSLFKNNTDVGEISIYFIEDRINNDSKKQIRSLVKEFDRTIVFINLDTIVSNLKNKDGFPVSAYARLFISNSILEDKILYIDCDTIINNALNDLWNTDLEDNLIAGVQDNPANYMLNTIGMKEEDRYINSGVMLINLKKWREENLEEKFYNFIEKYKGKVPHHDQGVINGVCRGSILIIHPRYNVMSQFYLYNALQIKKLFKIKEYYTQKELNEAINSPVVIHYIKKFYGRPWEMNCTHPLKEKYLNNITRAGLNIKLSKKDVNLKIKMRKWVFNNLPFNFYNLLESVLDFKRRRYYKDVSKLK